VRFFKGNCKLIYDIYRIKSSNPSQSASSA